MYFAIFLIIITFAGVKTEINCTTNDDCQLEQSTCSNGTCACNLGYIYNGEKSKCLPYATQYGDECDESVQCEWLGVDGECRHGLCLCKGALRWFQGGCRKSSGLEGPCSADSDCFDGVDLLALACRGGKCTCSTNYYLRAGGKDCRKPAKTTRDACMLDVDCARLANTTCILGKCKATPTRSPLPVQNSTWPQELGAKSAAAPAVQCRMGADCVNISNSECYAKTGTCVCKHGFFMTDKNGGRGCVAELGVDIGCWSGSTCKIRPGQCVGGACYCHDHWVSADGNRNCIKTMSQQNWNCLSREWCYPLGKYSYCSSSATCKCSQIADFDEHAMYCNKMRDVAGLCSADFECRDAGKYRMCVDERCVCRTNYRTEGGKCMPNIDMACADDSECTIPNSSCSESEKVCTCHANHIASVNGSQCLSVAPDLGAACQADVQCSAGIPYSGCINRTCNCVGGYVPGKRQCYLKREFNSYCSTEIECTASLGDTVACRKSKCQCPTYYKFKGGVCVSSGQAAAARFSIMGMMVVVVMVVIISNSLIVI